MTKGELCNMLIKQAAEYRNSDVLASLKRNNHMNQYKGEEISQETIDAILVDYLNFLGMQQGLDLGLYTHHLIEEAEKIANSNVEKIHRRLDAIN